jgi:hypothetical protein
MAARGSAHLRSVKGRSQDLSPAAAVDVLRELPESDPRAAPRNVTMARPRILFIGRSIAHISYFESIVSALQARGADVELLFDEAWSKSWSTGEKNRLDELRDENPDIKLGWSVRRADRWREALFAMRELRSYRSYLTRAETTKFYIDRWRNYLVPAFAKRSQMTFWRVLLKTGLADLLMRALERAAPCDPQVLALLREKRPDALVVTPANMRFSEETDYLKAARRLGVPTALPVLSWDNLSTKGLIQIEPDQVFVWNEAQYEDAIHIHKIPPRKVTIAGAPFFDKWFDEGFDLADRAAFCKRVGFDPDRKILLYLGSSANIASDESWFVEAVAARLAKSPDPVAAGAQILIRPHPANAKIYGRLEEKGMRVWPRDGALPETREQFALMRETFRHADAALGVNTSGMVDAVLADIPVFTIRIPRYADTQSNSRHFRQMTAARALYLQEDVTEFCKDLSAVFAGNDPLAPRRRAFSEAFARPCGAWRAAGDVIAEAIMRQALERRDV